jgi:hypothetical protein
MPFSRGVISGGGTPNLFTVSLMPFSRGVISKAFSFCKLLQDINKKHLTFKTDWSIVML